MNSILIERLGREGDGIGGGGGFHPYTLPGEEVIPGDPARILTASPHRITPACPHFERCGGCALQHASDPFLADWKEEVLRRALAAHGLEAPFRPIATSPPRSRRRATFTVRRTKKTVQFGFHQARSDRVEDITRCDLVLPGMLDLRALAEELARIGGSRKGALKMQIIGSACGWDVSITEGKPADGPMRATLAKAARVHDLARLSWNGEPVAMARPPTQTLGAAKVVPPPGAFLQATAEGEAALVDAVCTAIGDAARVADLFSGCGTFALPLAQGAEVHAVESDAEMLAALDIGWRGAQGLKRVTTQARDLFRRPLEPLELRQFDAVVLDPPRAGAEAQVGRLIEADVPVLAMVSCNPVSFARDAAALVSGGFTLDWVQVVDQFRWSGHLELVARFNRTSDP